MKRIHTIALSAFLATSLFLTSCGNGSNKGGQQKSDAYNILASVKNPAGIFSINVMDLLDKSNIKNAEEMPLQFKMIVNGQLNQHLNSENQGFKLEGNRPVIVSTTDENEFNYALTFFDVIDADKIGASLCSYFSGKVEVEGDICLLEAYLPGLPAKMHFVWDKKKLIFVATMDKDAKQIALDALNNKSTDAEENEEISNFLALENDFSSILFMENYSNMMNHYGGVKLDTELQAAYKGMIVKSAGNFNAGDITFETELKGDAFINSKFNTLQNKSVDASFFNYLTDNNQFIGYGATALDVEALVNIFDKTEQNAGYNLEKQLEKIGLKKEDLTTIFDGEFTASLIDIESIETKGYEGNMAFNKDRPKFLVSCGLKDSSQLKQLISSMSEFETVNNYFKQGELYYGITESKLFVSMNDSLIQKVTNGETLSQINQSSKSPIFGTMEMDLLKLPKGYKRVLMKNGGEEALMIYNQIEEFNFKGNINKTKLSLEFSDKTKNSAAVIASNVLKNLLPLLMSI